MLSWKNDQVLLWLKNSQQPDDVLECFRVHNITGLTLPLLNSEELKEMGISNLRQRLQILNDISTSLIEKNPHLGSLSLNNEHPLLSELQATVVSTSLIKNVSKGIVEETSSQLIDKMSGRERDHGESDKEGSTDKERMNNKEYRTLLTKINKLREEMLPVLKEIQDKKPLPAPIGRHSPNPIHNQSVKNESTLLPSASPSRSMFIANRRASSSETISSMSSEQVPLPIYPKSISSSAIPQKPSTQPTALPHRNSSHLTQLHGHSSSPNLIPSRSSKRMSSQQSETANPSNNISPATPASTDTLKQLRAKTEDPCYKILQAAMRSHKLDKSEWRNYVLIICYGGDKERVLRYDEKPVVVFKELSELGLSPSMMLRQVEDTDDTGYVNSEDYETPGGRL
ncbi:hypothetical protein PMKS-002801 [Pichia membranifaciens]|uniref:SAM domain-containing protein n=1 Tax=Pichia membranifaciens TaxID=4926 RepID=A0A1Q2YIE5_9ASCO|nr:hypothetical protein PMKS-002801 [Pichia membranifaciens]